MLGWFSLFTFHTDRLILHLMFNFVLFRPNAKESILFLLMIKHLFRFVNED